MRWIINFTIMVVLFGIIFGMVLGGLNPWKSPAEARQIDMLTEAEQREKELNFRLLETQINSQIQSVIDQDAYEAEQRRIQAFYQQEALEQSLRNRQLFANAGIIAIALLGGILSIAVVIYAVTLAIAKAVSIVRTSEPKTTSTRKIPEIQIVKPVPENEPYNPWNSEEYRRSKINEARNRERTARKEEQINLLVRMQSISNPASLRNAEYDDLPLAE